MSNSSKTITAVVVVVLVILGIWWYMSSSPSAYAPAAYNNQTGQYDQTASVSTAASNGSLTTSPNDTSDASLNRDMSNVDQGMNGLNADSAASANTN